MSITCQVCGTVNPDGTQFCEGCGVELKAQASTSAAPTPTSPELTTPEQTMPAEPTSTLTERTVIQPDLGTPVIPAAPTIPAAPVIPAPSLDNQASVPEGLTGSGDMPEAATQATDMAADLSASAQSTVPQTTDQQPTVSPAETTDAPASVVSSEPAGTDSVVTDAAAPAEVAPTLNPDLTSTADAPLADGSTNAPAMTDAPMTDAAPSSTDTTAAAPVTSAPAAGAPRTGAAKLGVKKFGTATGDAIPLQGERLMVGRFDASSGPVDIDLSSLPGAEHISRHHAELYRENGQWFVRDLGSTNGVFIKKAGQSAFSPRLQEPTALADGDELAFGNLMLTFQQEA